MFFCSPSDRQNLSEEKTQLAVASSDLNSCRISLCHTLLCISTHSILAWNSAFSTDISACHRLAFIEHKKHCPSSAKPSKWYFSIFSICTDLWRCVLAGGVDVLWQDSGPSNYPAWPGRQLAGQRTEGSGAVVRGLPCNRVHHDTILQQARTADNPTPTPTWKSQWLIQSSGSCLNQCCLTPSIWFGAQWLAPSLMSITLRLEPPCSMYIDVRLHALWRFSSYDLSCSSPFFRSWQYVILCLVVECYCNCRTCI